MKRAREKEKAEERNETRSEEKRYIEMVIKKQLSIKLYQGKKQKNKKLFS